MERIYDLSKLLIDLLIFYFTIKKINHNNNNDLQPVYIFLIYLWELHGNKYFFIVV